MPKHTYLYNGQPFSLDLTPAGQSFRATLADKTVTVQVVRRQAGHLDLLIDGRPVSATVTQDGAQRWVTVNNRTLLLTKTGLVRKDSTREEHSAGQLLSPMPGQVRAVQVSLDQPVTRGQTLVVVEAMKMEIKIAAPFDGKVKSLPVVTSQTVDKDQLLVEIEP